MSEDTKRLAPKKETLIRLFAKSGNKCAFENCTHKLFAADGTFIAEVCHIEAVMPKGERFNPKMNDEERRQEENLIVLCHAHHKISDNEDEYTVAKLKSIKQKHEAKFTSGGESIYLTDESYNSVVGKYERELERLLEILSKLVHFRLGSWHTKRNKIINLTVSAYSCRLAVSTLHKKRVSHFLPP